MCARAASDGNGDHLRGENESGRQTDHGNALLVELLTGLLQSVGHRTGAHDPRRRRRRRVHQTIGNVHPLVSSAAISPMSVLCSWSPPCSLAPGTFRARTPGDHMYLAYLETLRTRGERREQAARDLRRSLRVGDLSTPLADQVRVGARPRFEKGRAFRKATLHYQVRFPQRFERPVDRRKFHARKHVPGPLPDLFSAQVCP